VIVVVHNQGRVNEFLGVPGDESTSFSFRKDSRLPETLVDLGNRFPKELLIWVRVEWEAWLNKQELEALVPQSLVWISFRGKGDCFENRLDYVDFSTSVKVATEVRYPTWKMTASVGAAYGELFSAIGKSITLEDQEDYFFQKVARCLQPHGLLSYREPRLLIPGFPQIEEVVYSWATLFRFAGKEIALQWAFFLLLSVFFFDRLIRVNLAFKDFFLAIFLRLATLSSRAKLIS
jgi:hypothetical protein